MLTLTLSFSPTHSLSPARIGSATLLALFLGTAVPPAQAQDNPSFRGRTFQKVLAKGDPIPGAPGEIFTTIERLTVRDGKVHVVAGGSSTHRGLFRWEKGALTKLVYTDTVAPTGSTFDTVHFTTDETEGALNFVGEVSYGRPGAIYGLFEWRNGVITTVFDGTRTVQGKTLLGLGYPVRVGHEVVGATQFLENGALKNGVFRWDGTTLRTVIQSGDDLPGSLGGFTGHPGRYQIAFDGVNVGFVASADPQGKGPYGMYRAGPDGTITKLIDGNDKHPVQNGAKTYFQRGAPFVNLDLEGTNTFLGVYEEVAAAHAGNLFYTGPVRFADGTFDVATATFGTDGVYEEVLPYLLPDGVTIAKLDGKEWTNVFQVDGHGDDVALWVRLADGSQAIYAAVGATVEPPAAPVLAMPAVGGGKVTLRFGSVAGQSYRVEFKATLNAADWTPRATLAGTGGELEYSEDLAAAGLFRVVLLP